MSWQNVISGVWCLTLHTRHYHSKYLFCLHSMCNMYNCHKTTCKQVISHANHVESYGWPSSGAEAAALRREVEDKLSHAGYRSCMLEHAGTNRNWGVQTMHTDGGCYVQKGMQNLFARFGFNGDFVKMSWDSAQELNDLYQWLLIAQSCQ